MPIINCIICRNEVKNLKSALQTKLSLSLVCETCVKKHGEESVELIANIFLAYGGFEGQLKKEGDSFDKVLGRLTDKLNKLEEKDNIEQIIAITLHHLLLHDIGSKELKKSLGIV